MCFLVNGAVECTDYNDSDQVIYRELAKCEEMAAAGEEVGRGARTEEEGKESELEPGGPGKVP